MNTSIHIISWIAFAYGLVMIYMIFFHWLPNASNKEQSAEVKP